MRGGVRFSLYPTIMSPRYLAQGDGIVIASKHMLCIAHMPNNGREAPAPMNPTKPLNPMPILAGRTRIKGSI
jgi:hypothetical protein